MKRRTITAGLVGAAVLQAAVLAWEYVGAMMPLWTGQPVHLATVPYDPRSLFRGNYARLRYDVSVIRRADLDADRRIRRGEVVYVLLERGTDGLYEYAGASFQRPASGTYLRGRVQRVLGRRGDDIPARLRVRYGIEAWFAPKERALALEDALRDGGRAEVMVAASGKARLKRVGEVPEDRR